MRNRFKLLLRITNPNLQGNFAQFWKMRRSHAYLAPFAVHVRVHMHDEYTRDDINTVRYDMQPLRDEYAQ